MNVESIPMPQRSSQELIRLTGQVSGTALGLWDTNWECAPCLPCSQAIMDEAHLLITCIGRGRGVGCGQDLPWRQEPGFGQARTRS